MELQKKENESPDEPKKSEHEKKLEKEKKKKGEIKEEEVETDSKSDRKKSSLISDEQWKKAHSSTQSLADIKHQHKHSQDEDPKKKKAKKDGDVDPLAIDKNDSCEKRKSGGKSELIPDDEWKKCHSSV